IAVDFDPTPGTFPLTSNGQTDGYFIKYNWVGSSTLNGYMIGDTICNSKPAHLTIVFTTGGPGPFDITYSDGTTTYTVTGIMSGVPFTLPVSPTVNTTYSIISIVPSGGTLCAAPALGTFGTAVIA